MRIDFHVHAFPDKLAPKAMSVLAQHSGYEPQSDGTFANTCEKMSAGGNDKFVLLNIAQTPAQQKNANRFVIEKNGGNVIAFAAIHPFSDDAIYELDRRAGSGAEGCKIAS